MNGILSYYLLFLKYGLLCFGGGYMLVPFITADLVGEPPAPMAPEEFANLVSIAQITPGPVGLNTATYVGFTTNGIWGSLCATIGLVTPALFLVILAAKLLKKYESSIPIRGFLAGMKPASCGFICTALVIFSGWVLFAGVPGWNTFRWGAPLIVLAAFVILRKTKIALIPLLIGCAFAGAFLLQ